MNLICQIHALESFFLTFKATFLKQIDFKSVMKS